MFVATPALQASCGECGREVGLIPGRKTLARHNRVPHLSRSQRELLREVSETIAGLYIRRYCRASVTAQGLVALGLLECNFLDWSSLRQDRYILTERGWAALPFC